MEKFNSLFLYTTGILYKGEQVESIWYLIQKYISQFSNIAQLSQQILLHLYYNNPIDNAKICAIIKEKQKDRTTKELTNQTKRTNKPYNICVNFILTI